jgi:hypothetical protein
MRLKMTKTDERFVSKLELHILHRMLKGEKLCEHIESDRSTFIIGEEKRATRVRKNLIANMLKNYLIELNIRTHYKKGNVYYLGFVEKNKRQLQLTPVGEQIAKEFSV